MGERKWQREYRMGERVGVAKRGSVRESRGGKERVRDGGKRFKVGDGRERKCEREYRLGERD